MSKFNFELRNDLFFLFVIIMPFHFNNEDTHIFIVYIVDDAVMSRYAAGPGDFIATLQRFWMAYPHLGVF